MHQSFHGRTVGGVDLVALWLGWMNIWISLVVAGLSGYLCGLTIEVSCLMMVVEWIDDGG